MRGWDVSTLEEACWKAGREASKGLFLLAVAKRDEETVALAGGKQKGKVPRYLVTRFGMVTFRREKVKQPGSHSCCSLDKAEGRHKREGEEDI